MRKSLLIGVLFTLGSLLFFQAAWAHMSDLGPHNENGNVWMDLYRHQDFNGNLRAAAHNFSEEETGGLNKAPYPRIVSLFDAADLEVVRQPCVDDGNSESFFMHRKNGPDLVSMGNCVEYPKWILTHEIKHGYGGQHIENCAEVIEPDPRYLPEIRRSVTGAPRGGIRATSRDTTRVICATYRTSVRRLARFSRKAFQRTPRALFRPRRTRSRLATATGSSTRTSRPRSLRRKPTRQ